MNITEIRKQLPKGAGLEIAKMSGVNYNTVQRFLRGTETKHDLVIMENTAKFLKDYKDKKATAIQELQAVASA
jgi:DNA-binding transcriptional regulator YhcF (GntR family)